MPLPVTQHALFPLIVPSTGKEHMFRSFLVAEEKILLIAKETGLVPNIGLALQQVIRNCCMNEVLDTSTMTPFDMDYLFIKLRAASVNNIIKIRITDEDEKAYDVEVNLDDVENPVTAPLPTIDVEGTNAKMRFRYPTVKQLDDVLATEAAGDVLLNRLIRATVSMVYSDDEIYEFTDEEWDEWVLTLTPATYSAMKQVVEQIPVVTYTTHYTTEAGLRKEVVLRGLEDFFTLV
jgi:hypothetical protein